MDTPDFAAIIGRELHIRTHVESDDPDLASQSPEQCDDTSGEGWVGDTFLAYADVAGKALTARIPEACPTCRGTLTSDKLPGGAYCSHYFAPTIGTALAEWWTAREGQT